ncbi:MAG: right-handed parallel beta-helix repeat-containing protein [Chthoniobacteraceae bacterium]
MNSGQSLPRLVLVLACLGAMWAPVPVVAETSGPCGAQGVVGCMANPKTVSRLEITKPGVYENYRIDAQGGGGNIVKISADGVTLRNCEIFNGSGNGIGVFGKGVVIENCRIHHLLKGTFADQQDAHGITGRWGDVTIRHCDISRISGDCIQFDPDRRSSGSVVIDHCTLWTGPLPADAGGFKAGQRPGENAVDTKVPPDGPRCRLVIRDCFMHGWSQPAQIDTIAALNLKENVDAEVTRCVFDNNQVAFRVRGPGSRGGAHVAIADCAIYRTETGVRAEDKIELLKISGLAFGTGIGRRITFVNGRPAAGYENTDERDAPQMDDLLKHGFPLR